MDDLIADMLTQERRFWEYTVLEESPEIDLDQIQDNETREKV